MNIFLQDFSSNWYNLFHVFFPVASSLLLFNILYNVFGSLSALKVYL